VNSVESSGGNREHLIRSALSATLARLASDVLPVDSTDIPPGQSLFALGGDSVRATLLLARIRRELGVHITLREFLAEPTLDAIARHVRNRAEDGDLVHGLVASTPDLARQPTSAGQQDRRTGSEASS
jgi:aryl carrier-like protein